MIRAHIYGVTCLETRRAESRETRVKAKSTRSRGPQEKLLELRNLLVSCRRPSISSRNVDKFLARIRSNRSISIKTFCRPYVTLLIKLLLISNQPWTKCAFFLFAEIDLTHWAIPIYLPPEKCRFRQPQTRNLRRSWKKGSAVSLRTNGRVLKTRVAENSVVKARARPSLPCVRTEDGANPFFCI